MSPVGLWGAIGVAGEKAVDRKEPSVGPEGRGGRAERRRASLEESRRADDAGSEKSAKGSRNSPGWVKASPDSPGIDGMAIDPEELKEFAAPPEEGAQADPVFKERLRETLWEIVDERYGTSADESSEES